MFFATMGVSHIRTQHVILNRIQNLTACIEKEILNSHNFRELPRLTFQNDRKLACHPELVSGSLC